MKTAVLIPCYNEESTIEAVIKDFQKELPDADIYVFDNNCTDDTARIAAEAGAIVRKEKRQGKGNDMRFKKKPTYSFKLKPILFFLCYMTKLS